MNEANSTCPEGSITVACLTLGQAVVTVASMLTMMLIIVLGNLLVVVTVHGDRKLRAQRQNWLIVSLALADLLVGLLVMPLTLIYEVIGEWKLGMVLCEMWLALDVLFVTASILHICAISLDRYFSVTSPLTYPAKRTPKRMFIYIGVSWIVSLLICLPPIFGWRPDREPGQCTLSTDIGYVLYSSLGSFYIPVIILIIVYAKIYSITIRHSRQRRKENDRKDNTLNQLTKKCDKFEKPIVEMELIEDNSDPNDDNTNGEQKESLNSWQVSRKISEDDSNSGKKKVSFSNYIPTAQVNLDQNGRSPSPRSDSDKIAEKRRRKLKAKERQATLLLGIILSAFIFSWLPFFVMYVVGAFGYEPPAVVFKFFFWLGYCNSGINPVIYTVFNREFKRGLCRQLRKFERYLTPFSDIYK